MKQARRILFSAVVITLLLLIGMVGRLDYEDELAEEAFYEEMVCAGKWPDYKSLELYAVKLTEAQLGEAMKLRNQGVDNSVAINYLRGSL